MSGYCDAKSTYARWGVDTDKAIEILQTVPVALHCWQGDDVRGFDQKLGIYVGRCIVEGNVGGIDTHDLGLYCALDLVDPNCFGVVSKGVGADFVHVFNQLLDCHFPTPIYVNSALTVYLS